MAKIYPKQLIVSGSDLQSGRPTTGGGEYDVGYLSVSMSISDALNAVAQEGSGTIGTPDDGTYDDGYFDYWTSDTRIPNAFDDVNEFLLQTAPDSPDALDGQSLVRSSPSVFSGYLSAGLSGSWYVGVSAGAPLTTLVTGNYSTALVLISPNQSTRFTGGASGSFADLSGSVNTLRGIGISDPTLTGTRPLSSKTGSTWNINITDISVYNNIWLKVNAQIEDIFNETGSWRFVMDADNSGGTTNTYQFFFVGNDALGTFPDQSFGDSPYTSSVSPQWKYMSGINYYGQGTAFDINYKGVDLYSPVYSKGDETLILSSYFSTATVSTSSITAPEYWWDFPVTQSRTLTNGIKSLYNALGTYTVRLQKDGKTDVPSAAVNLGIRPINTYLTRSTDLLEYFDDEVYRWYGITSQSWDNRRALWSGQSEVNNGRLIDPKWSNYEGGIVITGSNHYYYRPFYSVKPNINGTITIAREGFSELSSTIVGEWGSSDELQVSFVIASESGSTIYDLGRAVGDNTGNIIGIRNSAISGDTITWGLPSGQVTAADPFIIMIRLLGTEPSDYVKQITMTYELG